MKIRISNLLSAKLALVPEAVEKLKNESQEKEYGKWTSLPAAFREKSRKLSGKWRGTGCV